MACDRVCIVGDGQMGLVLAAVLSERTDLKRVTLWGHESAAMDALAQTRRSARLPGWTLPAGLVVTGDDAEALDGAKLIISAVPTQFVRGVWERLGPHAPAADKAGIVSVAKGIENGTLLRPTQIVADAIGDDPDGPPRGYAVLSGPTIAAELARQLPATMIAASEEAELARQVQALFSTNWMRIYTGVDPLGVEIAGATKNVIAIAAGIIDGLKAGYNAKSALLARGLAEIARLGSIMGAQTETFFGLAGVGDLATTCFSPEGRNRSCGEALGKGETAAAYIARTQSVVEGVATTSAVMGLAAKYRVEMPITAAVNAVIYEGLEPIEAISRLMSRDLKAERVG